MDESLPKELRAVMMAAEEVLVDCGKHVPRVLCSNSKRLAICAIIEMDSNDAKDRVAAHLQQLIVRPGFEWLAFINEAWCVECADPEPVLAWRAEHGSLAGFPGRLEHLVIQFVSNEVELLLRAPILRDGDRVALGSWEQLPVGKESSLFDRFSGLARRAKAGQQ